MRRFTGKHAVITGAAHGVGRALAIAFAQRGCNIIAVDIDAVNLDTTLSHPIFQTVRVLKLVQDISLKEHWSRGVADIEKHFGQVDILINCAAVSVEAPMNVYPVEDIDWVIDINLKGAIYATKFLMPLMEKSKEGYLVNVSSTAGLSGFPNKTLYCASKFGLKGLTESLATELAGSHIQVACAHPGPIKTDMLSRSHIYDKQKEQQMRDYLSTKGNTPEEVALAIIKGMERNKLEILISSETKSVWWMKRLIPNLFVKLIGKYRDKLPA